MTDRLEYLVSNSVRLIVLYFRLFNACRLYLLASASIRMIKFAALIGRVIVIVDLNSPRKIIVLLGRI